MKTRWSPEGGLKFIVLMNKIQQLKYAGTISTHTPGTLRAILSGVLNRLCKNRLAKTLFNSEGVDKIYPDHANALREAGLAPPIFLIME